MTRGKDDTSLNQQYGTGKNIQSMFKYQNLQKEEKKKELLLLPSQTIRTPCITHFNINFFLLIHNKSLKCIPPPLSQQFTSMPCELLYFLPKSCAVHSKFLLTNQFLQISIATSISVVCLHETAIFNNFSFSFMTLLSIHLYHSFYLSYSVPV